MGAPWPILLVGFSGAPFSADAGERGRLKALLRLADELAAVSNLHLDKAAAKAGSAEQRRLVARLVRSSESPFP